MQLTALTSPALISTGQTFDNKQAIIRRLVRQLFQAGKLHSEAAFYQAVMERESLSATGLEGGLAIPHGKSKAVKDAAFAVMTLKKPITTWESLDPDNQVELIILLAIPEAEAGSLHLSLLAELSTRLADPDYKQRLLRSKTADELYHNLDAKPEERQAAPGAKQGGRTILAVTACPAGIAHTYMAAEALRRAGEELGVDVYVEKQGANGIEDRHTSDLLRRADAVIFAVDVAVKEEQRYAHLPHVKTSVASPLKNARDIVSRALDKAGAAPRRDDPHPAETPVRHDDEPTSFGTEVKNAVLTGISYIVPVIVAGGMTLATAVLISQAFGLQAVYNAQNSWLWLLRQLGGQLLGTLMVPILAAYMAYSIADKPGMGPGFAAGVAANLIGSGFLGGMLGGLVAGYVLKWLKRTVQPRGTFAGFISFWLYPVAGTLIVGSIMLFIVGRPLAAINQGLIGWLNGLSGANALLLGAILGAMVSFDLGGPVNKAAYTFCIGAMANGNIVPYAAFASVKMVSAFAVTGATLFAKQLFTEAEQEVGKQTWLLGLAGITEGAIPLMMNDPLRVIPSLVAGSAITGALVAYFRVGLNVPGAGIFSLAFLQGPPALAAAAVWLGAALLGAAISMALLIATRKARLRGEPAK